MVTAREFLENARRLNRLIQSTEETLESLSDIHAVAPREGGKSGKNTDGEVNKAIRRAELQDKLAEYMEHLWHYKAALVEITTHSSISYISRTLIQQRYMLSKSWKQVARFLDYELYYTKRELNKEAIEEVEKFNGLWKRLKTPH